MLHVCKICIIRYIDELCASSALLRGVFQHQFLKATCPVHHLSIGDFKILHMWI